MRKKHLYLNKLRAFIKKSISFTGYELTNKYHDKDNLNFFLEKKEIGTVIDIGANTGQFGISLRNQGFKGKIISFEPVKIAYEELLLNSKNDLNWQVFRRCAIGSKSQKTEINVSNNLYSSSILPMTEIHQKNATRSKYSSKETIDVLRLDDIYGEIIKENINYFLKIDTQGYEMEVLEGAEKIISSNLCKGILSELSFVELYSGSTLWLELIKFLEKYFI